jgi:hypothetical protein
VGGLFGGASVDDGVFLLAPGEAEIYLRRS